MPTTMEKQEFIRLAPDYYYAAVAIAISQTEGIFTVETLRDYWSEKEEGTEYLFNVVLIELALQKMAILGAIKEMRDPFGPALYHKAAGFEDLVVEVLRTDLAGPYYRNEQANNYGRWMRAALKRVNDEYFYHGLSANDFEQPTIDEWTPIPLDPDSPALQDAIAKLDDTIQQVEQSNGYADKHPEERRYILDGLKSLSSTLKTASSVSVQYLKRNGFELLKKVRDRFTSTIIDQSAKASSDALIRWIKEKAGDLIGQFWPF